MSASTTPPINARILAGATATATAMANETLVMGAWIQNEVNTSRDELRSRPRDVPATLTATLTADAAIAETAANVHYREVLRKAGEVLLGATDAAKLVTVSAAVVRRTKALQVTIYADRYQREVDDEPQLDATTFPDLFDPSRMLDERSAARARFLEQFEDDAAWYGQKEALELIDDLFNSYKYGVAAPLYEKTDRVIPLSRIQEFWYNHVYGLFMYGLLLVEASYAATPEQSKSYAGTAFRRLQDVAAESEQFTNSLIRKIVLNE